MLQSVLISPRAKYHCLQNCRQLLTDALGLLFLHTHHSPCPSISGFSDFQVFPGVCLLVHSFMAQFSAHHMNALLVSIWQTSTLFKTLCFCEVCLFPPSRPETRFSCTVQAGFNLLIPYLRLAGTLATVADSSLYWPRQNWTQPSRGLCGIQLCLGTSHSTIPIDPAIWVFLKNVAYIYIISVPSRPGTAPYTQEGRFIFEYLKCFGQTIFLFKIRRFLCQFLLLIISWIQDLISKICDNLPLIEWECIDYLL